MPSRRHIRETVVQFLYCAHLEDGPPPRDWRDTFWELVTESDRRRLQVAMARTVAHLSHGRDDRLAEFVARLPQALAILTARPETSHLRAALESLNELESKWSAAFQLLRHQPLDGADDEVATNLTDRLDALFRIDRSLATQREQFLTNLADYPALQGLLEPVAAPLRRLQRISDRLRMVEQPEHFPEQADLAHLRESRDELAELRKHADGIVDGVLEHSAEIDAKLASIIENFAPERIDPVDRAILRLAAWEILHVPNLPHAVAINEAVEIARRFGSTDSPRFVNGILDRIAKSAG